MTKPFGDIVQFASRNAGEGVLIEPRFFFDFLNFDALPDGTTVAYNGDPAAYSNGEQFPVRITHMIASPMHKYLDTGEVDWIYNRPSTIQSLFLRVERYGEYYMNEQFIRATAWHNVGTAQPYNLSAGAVTHQLFQPLVLSSRDSMRVEIESLIGAPRGLVIPPPGAPSGATTIFTRNAPDSDYVPPEVIVQMTGVGMASGSPYLFAGPARPTQTSGGRLLFLVDPANLQNRGNEPVAITSMTFLANIPFANVVDEDVTTGLFGDTRFFRVYIKQQGNGTQAAWMRGPTFPTEVKRMPLSLFGTSLGDAVVHRFPGDGITLDPNEMLRVSAQRDLTTTDPDYIPTEFAVGFAGYLMVK